MRPLLHRLGVMPFGGLLVSMSQHQGGLRETASGVQQHRGRVSGSSIRAPRRHHLVDRSVVSRGEGSGGLRIAARRAPAHDDDARKRHDGKPKVHGPQCAGSPLRPCRIKSCRSVDSRRTRKSTGLDNVGDVLTRGRSERRKVGGSTPPLATRNRLQRNGFGRRSFLLNL